MTPEHLAPLTPTHPETAQRIARRSAPSFTTLTALFLSASLLAACGGGGGDAEAASQPGSGTPASALADANPLSLDQGTPAPFSLPEDDIWFLDEAAFNPEGQSTTDTKEGVTTKASATQPVIVRAPAFGPAGQTVRVGTPIVRVTGVYRNGVAVAGFRSRDGRDIPEGRQASYTPTTADIGKRLVYRERVINQRTGEYIFAYSSPVTVVAADTPSTDNRASKPVSLRAPLIAGGNTRIRAGRPVSAIAGVYQNGQISSRQWLRDGQPIAGATAETYTPTRADVGKKLGYVETVRTPAGSNPVQVQAGTVSVVADNYPSIHTMPRTSVASQTAEVGQMVRGTSGVYQWGRVRQAFWMVDNALTAKGDSYTVTAADLGKTLAYTEEIEGDSGDVVWLSAPAIKVVAAKSAASASSTSASSQPVTPAPTPVAGGNGSAVPGLNLGGNGQNTPATPGARPASNASIAANDVCRDILLRNNPLQRGQESARVPDRQIPATGVAVQEPTYGTCQVRLTHNGQKAGDEKSHRSDYSRRQAFNADNSRILMYASNGYWHLYDGHTGKYLKQLQGPAGDAEPQWHPTNPDVLYYVPNNGWGMTITELNVASDQRRVVGDLGARLKSFWPTAATAWTKSEGAPSADGRYWCLMVDNNQWQGVGVVTWDMKEDRILGRMNLPARPDHVSMSPSGQYCVVSWAHNRELGTRAYTRDFTTPHAASAARQPYVKLHEQSEHSDLALNKQGEDVYVAIDYQADRGDVFMVNLKTGKRTSLFPTYLSGTATAIHFSGKAYGKPGWALVSTYGEYHASNQASSLRNTAMQQWMHRKIFAVSLEENPQIRPLAHADSDSKSSWGSDAYWAEPQATVNSDFTRVLFNSTLNSSRIQDVETYMLALPKGALDK